MHPIQDLFLEGFSYVLQFDMHFICTPMWTKFYSCEKWVLHYQKEEEARVFPENTHRGDQEDRPNHHDYRNYGYGIHGNS
jgi:hypothetical protein